MSRLLKALHSGRVLLMDGAMGTELQRAGLPDGTCCAEWNLTHPEKVLAIHKAYVEAGAEVVLTNTFLTHPVALKMHGLQARMDEILERAADISRSSRARFTLGDFVPLAPGENLRVGQKGWKAMAKALQGVDGILLETCFDSSAFQVADWLRVDTTPILVSFCYRPGEAWMDSPERLAAYAKKHGIAALGVNCGKTHDPAVLIETLHQYRAATDLPLFARPNAGTPTKVDGRWQYPITPEQMAAAVPAMIEAGATMIGGCCGTTPEHIAAMRKEVGAWNARLN